MRYLFIFFNLLSAFSFADPFYEQENQQTPTQNGKNGEKMPACLPDRKVNELSLTTDFDKLQLVGIMQIDDRIRALFIDDKKQLIDLYPNDYLTFSSIQIKEIDFKSIRYIDWQKTTNCQSPTLFTLKF